MNKMTLYYALILAIAVSVYLIHTYSNNITISSFNTTGFILSIMTSLLGIGYLYYTESVEKTGNVRTNSGSVATISNKSNQAEKINNAPFNNTSQSQIE